VTMASSSPVRGGLVASLTANKKPQASPRAATPSSSTVSPPPQRSVGELGAQKAALKELRPHSPLRGVGARNLLGNTTPPPPRPQRRSITPTPQVNKRASAHSLSVGGNGASEFDSLIIRVEKLERALYGERTERLALQARLRKLEDSSQVSRSFAVWVEVVRL
jgi:hypothetical protein